MADRSEPTELTALKRALALSREELGADGISSDEIALVEATWEIADTVVPSFGWVLALKGGRRVYLEYTLDGTQSDSEELQLVDMRPDEGYPTLEQNAGVFWYRPDHLNRLLGITPPALH